MSTRNRAQREEQKEFVGRVNEWRKIPVTIGDSMEGNTFEAQKWAVTGRCILLSSVEGWCSAISDSDHTLSPRSLLTQTKKRQRPMAHASLI